MTSEVHTSTLQVKEARASWHSSPAAKLHRKDPLDRAAYALAMAIALLTLAVFRIYAVDFPYADDFSQLLSVPIDLHGLPHWVDQIKYLASLSVEHRIATLRIAAASLAHTPIGLDFVHLMALGWLLLALALVLVVHAAPAGVRGYVALASICLSAAPFNYEAQYWATGALQHFGVIAFAMLAIRASAMATSSGGAIAVVAASLASLTSANGLLAFVAVSGTAFLSGQRWRSGVGMVCFLLAASLYWRGGATSQVDISVLGILRFASISVGSVADSAHLAILLSCVLAITWGWIAMQSRRPPSYVVGWFTFLLLSSLAVAIGRHSFGDAGALLSRYKIYSAIAVLVTLVAVLHALDAKRAAFARVMAACGVAVFLSAVAFKGADLRNASLLQRARLDETVHANETDYGAWPPLAHAQYLLDRATALRYYDPRARARPAAVPAKQNGHPAVLRVSPVSVEYIAQRGKFLSLFGTVDAGTTEVGVWLADSDRVYSVVLPAVVDPIARLHSKMTVVGSIDLRGIPPGDYSVGFSAGTHGVFWTPSIVAIRH